MRPRTRCSTRSATCTSPTPPKSCPPSKKQYIFNMAYLGLNILTRRRVQHNRPPVRARPLEGKYESARWTPYVVDLIEDILDSKLRKDAYPIVPQDDAKEVPEPKEESIDQPRESMALRSGRRPQQHHHSHHPSFVKRVIVCFIGGVTFAETQAV